MSILHFIQRKPLFYWALLPIFFFFFLVNKPWWLPINDSQEMLQGYHEFLRTFAYEAPFPFWTRAAWGGVSNVSLLSAVSPSMLALSILVKFFPTLSSINLFFLSFFLDELLLALGTYLLAKLFFKHIYTILFVVCSLSSSVDWSSQAYFNFRVYYILPLAWFFILFGLRKRELAPLFFGFFLSVFYGLVGSSIYIAVTNVLTSSIVFLTGFFHFRVSPDELFKKTKTSDFAFGGVLVLSTLLLLAFLLHPGFAYFADEGRRLDGTLNYWDFLDHSHDGSQAFRLFDEPVSGSRIAYNTSIYGGALLLPLVLFALLHVPLLNLTIFLGLFLFLFLFYFGKYSFLSPLLFHFPAVSYFRFLTLTAPLLKLPLLFLAGYGWETLYKSRNGHTREAKTLLLSGSLVLILFTLVSPLHSYFLSKAVPEVNATRCLFVFILRCLMAIVFLRLLLPSRSRNSKLPFMVLLILVLVDLLSFRYWNYHEKLLPLKKAHRSLFELSPPSFNESRTRTDSLLAHSLSSLIATEGGHLYKDKFAALLGKEVCFPDKVGQPFLPSTGPLYTYAQGKTPATNQSLDQLIGCDAPKYSLFRNIQIANSPLELFHNVLASSQIQLQVTRSDWEKYSLDPAPAFEFPSQPLPRPQVLSHKTHHLSFKIPSDPLQKDRWFYYSDGWHPFWKAFWNGKEVPILKAFTAFKTVRLTSEEGVLEFRLATGWQNFLGYSLFLMALCLTLVGLFFSLRIQRILKTPFRPKFRTRHQDTPPIHLPWYNKAG